MGVVVRMGAGAVVVVVSAVSAGFGDVTVVVAGTLSGTVVMMGISVGSAVARNSPVSVCLLCAGVFGRRVGDTWLGGDDVVQLHRDVLLGILGVDMEVAGLSRLAFCLRRLADADVARQEQ